MAGDLISRKALLQKFAKSTWHDGRIFNEEGYFVRAYDVHNMIDNAPAVDAEPVRHAEWIPCVINGKQTKLFMTCSGCRRYQWPRSEVPLFRRCPKCGAIMDGGSKAVDVVKVVRCEDCAHSKREGNALRCPYSTVDLDPNGYCHRGVVENVGSPD